MTEVAPVVAPVVEKKKWIREYQPKDDSGNPIGPIQRFEADTREEMIDKLAAAHENASSKLYQTRREVKLGSMLEPDAEEPINTFEPRQLTADERVKLTKDLSDPAKAAEAHRTLLEAELGAPIEIVREGLRDREIQKRVEAIRGAIAQFKRETPEYVECEQNSDNMKKYMEKKNLKYSAKNLKIAFEDLSNNGLIVVQAPRAAVTEPVVAPVATTPAPATPEVIPPVATTTPAIPAQSTEVRPKQSSSGLGRDNSSAAPGVEAPKTLGISYREINAMPSGDYAKALLEGIPSRGISAQQFKDAIDKLYKK